MIAVIVALCVGIYLVRRVMQWAAARRTAVQDAETGRWYDAYGRVVPGMLALIGVGVLGIALTILAVAEGARRVGAPRLLLRVVQAAERMVLAVLRPLLDILARLLRLIGL